MLVMVGDLVGLLVSNNATLVRLQKVEACANLSVQKRRARCHIGGSMRCGAIIKRAGNWTLGEEG